MAETVDVDEIDAEKAELAKLAVAEDDDDDDDDELEGESKEKVGEKPKEEVKETPAELTKEQVAELAKKHGLIDEKPAQTTAVTEGKKSPPKLPAFKDEAFAEAWDYEEFVEDDGEGGKVLSDAGLQWAESRAIQLATEFSNRERTQQEAERRTQELTQQLQARKPQIVEEFTQELIKGGKLDEEVVKAFTPRMVDILVGFGAAAFDDGSEESDPKVKEAKSKLSLNLRTSAYYQALGVEYEKRMLAEAEGGDEGDTPKEKVVSEKRPPSKDEITMETFSKEDQAWIKRVWVTEVNDGKPPTKDDLKKLHKELNK